ncbi:metal ABC transporter substrate-binding protein [Micromonospora echinospora]|uniref:metal ABC transporter substrate-binding protein n=1 Tax=Micromonospora echinospora TaxID=1877 RepID=UPI0034239FBF
MTVRAPRRILTAAAAALLAAAGLTACADGTGAASEPGKVGVVAAFYPLQFLSERIGGDTVTVSNLTKPGAEPHDLELNPRQVGQVVDADVVVYLSGFQPAVDEAVEQNGGDRAFDVAGVTPLRDAAAGGHDHDHEGEWEAGHSGEGGGKDPHVWLDPTRLATIGDNLAERLGKADPEHAADYTTRAGALRAELTKLDTEFTDGLRTCTRREIVTSHAAFGYLTERYRLEQIGISGLTPESEPSPQRLAEVAEEAREHQAGTIFFETLVSPKVAETIAREVGAKTAVLDPLEGPPADGDYLSAMRANLQTLRTALDCS